MKWKEKRKYNPEYGDIQTEKIFLLYPRLCSYDNHWYWLESVYERYVWTQLHYGDRWVYQKILPCK